MLNTPLFKQKFNTLKAFKHLNPTMIEALETALYQLEPWDLYRLNPLKLIDNQIFEQHALLDILLHAVKIGVFDIFWTPICPGCGGIEHRTHDLNTLKSGYIPCTTCAMDIELDLAKHVEVCFQLNTAMVDAQTDFNPFSSFENYLRYYFSTHLEQSEPLQKYIQQHLKGFRVLEPGQKLELRLDTQPNSVWRLINLQSHSQLLLQVGSPSPQNLTYRSDLLHTGFTPAEHLLPPGHHHFWIDNPENISRPLTLWTADFEQLHAILSAHPNRYRPFLSAQTLLNHQTFHELFKINALAPDFHLKISSQTVLFTDLKGSTAMYEEKGDYDAYLWVRRHFEALTAITHQHRGAVVKTMGDAIMATFSRPDDGILAALDMLKRISEIPTDSSHLGLKLGLHEGPALVVNANNQLDYFGQTVNLAARIQGLADLGELWISEGLIEVANPLLKNAGYKWEQKKAQLKGIKNTTLVYRCTKKHPLQLL